METTVKWVMLISGVLTSTMFYGLFAPQMALESMFGVSFSGSLEDLIVRSWSALVGLMGFVLIYGFFNEGFRSYAISIAAFSKFVFVALVLIYGGEFLEKVLPAITLDMFVVVIAVLYLSKHYLVKKSQTSFDGNATS